MENRKSIEVVNLLGSMEAIIEAYDFGVDLGKLEKNDYVEKLRVKVEALRKVVFED